MGANPGEINDDAKHFDTHGTYTRGTVVLKAVVDDLGEITQKVVGKTRLKLKRLYASAPEGVDALHEIDWDEEEDR
jgi:hypothetical protein